MNKFLEAFQEAFGTLPGSAYEALIPEAWAGRNAHEPQPELHSLRDDHAKPDHSQQPGRDQDRGMDI